MQEPIPLDSLLGFTIHLIRTPHYDPPMLTLRLATPADALAVATVHVHAWQEGYRGLIANEHLEALRPEDRAARYTFGSTDPNAPETVVVELDNVVCGFATIGPCREEGPGTGELLALHVDPRAWGIGAGKMLIADARARLVARGFAEAVLWVLVGNERAQRFYGIDGWRADDVERTIEIWGVEILDTRFRRHLP